MTKSRTLSREDENLRRMLNTPPKPHSEMKVRKAKASRPIRAKAKKASGKT
jgi:hypothetical protein